ncbi:hypothetical protein BDQ12DRAFT_671024 [Crucibulum laeve]|uniref:Uncharacterized protein n=1 Tax=Crucibulum laeve TaxID=68775 RepID=A0A5C3LII3_9AGAR|nr:hypothetical protein BDQ12DRAFT_671024 [Crucibulum laeve]
MTIFIAAFNMICVACYFHLLSTIRTIFKGYKLGILAQCLYQDYRGNTLDLEDGFLWSLLLVKPQHDDAAGNEDLNSIVPPATYQHTLKMGCRSLSIKFVFALSSAPQWTIIHQGLNFYRYSQLQHLLGQLAQPRHNRN